MSLPYSEEVIKYFMNPKNVGQIDEPDAVATEGSPACGDMVKMYLKINPCTHIIEDIKFKSYGCASNIATASIITELVKGRTIEYAKMLTWKDVEKTLGGLPPVKVHCAVLAADALKTAIENYEHTHGLIKNKKPTTLEVIRKRLSHVIDPTKGISILKSGLLNRVTLENGIVTVYTNVSKSHQFAGNIKEEIKERLEPLWDVKKVIISFCDAP